MMKSREEVGKELADAAAQLTDAGMLRGWSGQFSARCIQPDGYSVVIKRSGGRADDPAAYCHVDCKGSSPEPTDARPSLVTQVHCAIYSSCSDVQAVVQCRGVYADAIAVVLGEMPLSLETFWALKAPPIVLGANALRSDTLDEYVERMAAAVSSSLAKAEEITSAVCIPFYGMWVTGASAAEAVGRTIALEDMAKSAYLRLSLASTLSLSKPDFPVWFSDMLKGLRRPRAE